MTAEQKQDLIKVVQKISAVAGSNSAITEELIAVFFASFDRYIAESVPGGITSIPTGGILWVDSIYGNDSTAVPYDAAKPYASLSAAQGAANSGDEIFVQPGVYSDSNLGKDGVNWYFAPNCLISANFVNTSGSGHSYKIRGYAEFSFSGTVFAYTRPSANITIECKSINAVSGTAVFCNSTAGFLNIKVTCETVNAGTGFSIRGNTNASLYVNYITATGQAAIMCKSTFNGTVFARGVLYTASGTSNFFHTIFVDADCTTSAKVTIYADLEHTGTLVKNTEGCLSCYAGTVEVYGDVNSAGLRAIHLSPSATPGFVKILGDVKSTLNSAIVHEREDTILEITGNVQSLAAGENDSAISIISGDPDSKLRLINSRVRSNKHGIFINVNGNLIVDDATIIVDVPGSYNSISSGGSPVTFKINRNLAVNAPIDAAINSIVGSILTVDNNIE